MTNGRDVRNPVESELPLAVRVYLRVCVPASVLSVMTGCSREIVMSQPCRLNQIQSSALAIYVQQELTLALVRNG